MKKWFAICMTCVMLFLITACGNDNPVVGKWSMDLNKDGTQTKVIEFKNDGSGSRYQTHNGESWIIDNFTYEVKSDTGEIFITYPMCDPHAWKYSREGNNLMIGDEIYSKK